MTIDISTGDVITPNAVKFSFNGLFDNEIKFELWAYNIETVLAEKIETILRRSVFNTRPRDFYDAYILITTQKFNKTVFDEALNKTIEHRGTANQINNFADILSVIANSEDLKKMWNNYKNQFAYAKDIEYSDIINELILLLNK